MQADDCALGRVSGKGDSPWGGYSILCQRGMSCKSRPRRVTPTRSSISSVIASSPQLASQRVRDTPKGAGLADPTFPNPDDPPAGEPEQS